MLDAAHQRMRPILERRDHGFRWRGTDCSRIEGLSDAVFGFAVTLLVVSLEAPHRFAELRHLMHGFVSFGICFTVLLLIWHTQYLYFRRYALDDQPTFILNAMLLFVVAFYVYPLKFLFTVLVNMITGYRETDASGRVIEAMQSADWRPLMFIYSLGFIALYVIFALLYLHALRNREALELNELETFETRGAVQENLVMVAIGVTSMILALTGHTALSGYTYMLIGPAQGVLGTRHGYARKRIVSEMSPAAA